MAKPPLAEATGFLRIHRGMNMSRHPAKALILAVAAAVLAACSSGGTSNTSSTQNFSGVTVHIVTFTGPQIAEPLLERHRAFLQGLQRHVQGQGLHDPPRR